MISGGPSPPPVNQKWKCTSFLIKFCLILKFYKNSQIFDPNWISFWIHHCSETDQQCATKKLRSSKLLKIIFSVCNFFQNTENLTVWLFWSINDLYSCAQNILNFSMHSRTPEIVIYDVNKAYTNGYVKRVFNRYKIIHIFDHYVYII